MTNKIIIGHDEIAYHLAWHAFYRFYSRGPKTWNKVGKIYRDFYSKNRDFNTDPDEMWGRIYKSASKDLGAWVEWIKYLKANFQKLSHIIAEQVPVLDKQLGKGNKDKGRRTLYRLLNQGAKSGFAKTLGRQLLPNADYEFPREYVDADDIFIRNIIHNEDIILDRMINDKPFWFVDSGYTNFIHGGNKRFHRITRNDLHHGINYTIFPADRLSKFDSFPRPWRMGGDKILIIEPSKYICQLYKIDISKWREEVKETLGKHTDKKIVWREKEGTRTTRGNLYLDLLEDESVY